MMTDYFLKSGDGINFFFEEGAFSTDTGPFLLLNNDGTMTTTTNDCGVVTCVYIPKKSDITRTIEQILRVYQPEMSPNCLDFRRAGHV